MTQFLYALTIFLGGQYPFAVPYFAMHRIGSAVAGRTKVMELALMGSVPLTERAECTGNHRSF